MKATIRRRIFPPIIRLVNYWREINNSPLQALMVVRFVDSTKDRNNESINDQGWDNWRSGGFDCQPQSPQTPEKFLRVVQSSY